MRALVAAAFGLALAAPAAVCAQAKMEEVKASAADPAVTQFEGPSVVLTPAGSTAATPLAIFLSGTGGKLGGPPPFLQVIAGQGYRVIGLAYDDEPAVSQVCPRDPDPGCSGDFRRMRLYGDGPSRTVSNTAAASIQGRLVALLTWLDRTHPGQGWGGYLKDGAPDWSRMALSGLSQGAGMAAYIAKQHLAARVVLFSSPWDFYGPDRTPAPWLSGPSATPMDRWYAEVNARENTAPAIRRAYAALRIPPDHLRVFSRDLPAGYVATGPNPYHPVTIRDPAYADDWRAMYGRAADVPPTAAPAR